MKTLFDTSVIIAALVESHPMHGRAFPWLKRAKEKQFELIIDHFRKVWQEGDDIIIAP